MKLEEVRAAFAGEPMPEPPEDFAAAVMVPLTELNGEAALLLEVRAKALRSQPGECCFPGGRMEPGETPSECALRETEEELGLTGSSLLCPLQPLRHSSGQLIYPWLGEVSGLEQLRIQPTEVEEVFSVPLAWFLVNPPHWTSYTMAALEEGAEHPLAAFLPHYRKTRKTPYWVWNGHTIWGMTAKIILGLTEALNGKLEGRG